MSIQYVQKIYPGGYLDRLSKLIDEGVQLTKLENRECPLC